MPAHLDNTTRDAAITAFRGRICEACNIVPLHHQAEWWAATDGSLLLDVESSDGTLVRQPDDSTVRLALAPRPGGRARVVADLGAFKVGKSFGAGVWASSFACIPNARIQLVGLEYDICSPEFEYIVETLLSGNGLGLKYESLQNRPRDGRMWLDLPNGARFEARSWERKDTLKGKEIDAYVYCLPLDAPVWMGDYSFRRLEDIEIGDEVISGQPKGSSPSKTKLQRARVNAIHRTQKEVLRLLFASGKTAYCTVDHKWLSGSALHEHYILPKVGAKLSRVVEDPGLAKDPLTCAWIAGMYDGEGCRTMISQDREANADLHNILKQRLEAVGFETTSTHDGVRWLGGRQAAIKFVNQIPSIRFRKQYADKAILGGRYKTPDQIVSVDSCGVQDVGCLTTTTGNFIAYGLQTSNCEAYMLPGLECYTGFSQNLRARSGYAVFATTPDRPWVNELHTNSHSGDPRFVDWHCTCGIPASANANTFDARAMARDEGLMTHEKFQIHYLGKMGVFARTVYGFQRGERVFTPQSHPFLFRDGNLSIPDGWEIVGGADTGTYTSAVLVAFSPEGEAFVIDEFPNYSYVAGVPELDESATIPSWSADVTLRLTTLSARSAFWADLNSQFKRELRRYDIHLLPNRTPFEARTEIAREYFTHNRVWLASHLKVLPFELENAKWPEVATSAGRFTRVKDRDHTLDSLEHVLSRRPQGKWALMEKEKGRWIDGFVGGARVSLPGGPNPHLGRN